MLIETTPIAGLLVVRLAVHGDARGWFKENWQREKMVAAGLPDFGPVQNNISFNGARGVTRGVHAEPWDKLVSVATGRVFAAWVDLRAGAGFGTVWSVEIDESVAVFVPRGVGNSYQTLTDNTAYSYLVNEHWRPGVPYLAVELGHPGINWPIPLRSAVISEKDLANPPLAQVEPFAVAETASSTADSPLRVAIVGANGQVGRALRAEFPDAVRFTRAELELSQPGAVGRVDWSGYDVVLNAAAYTAVDAAEVDRANAWQVNAHALADLAAATATAGARLVHFSTDYVYAGDRPEHVEDEPVAPLGVYGQSKAAGDLAIAVNPRHYVLRTSWVIGEGRNFVRTMAGLAARGVSPTVVNDQFGRLTFAEELARATRHLLATSGAYGVYHCSNSGPVQSWADIAAEVYALVGADPDAVRGISSAEYFADKPDAAPRPQHSGLDLAKLKATGFNPRPAGVLLAEYVARPCGPGGATVSYP